VVDQWIPAGSHFDQQSRNHLLVHLDARNWRVAADCERVANMRHVSWLVLPPAQDYYYRRSHAHYRELPAYRADCIDTRGGDDGRPLLDFIYPVNNAKLYLPVELDGKTSHAVFEAVNRDRRGLLYWHLDDQYLGKTETIHQMNVTMTSGLHTVTVVDASGQRAARAFELLPQEKHQ
jgi:penicillin-binding protein 1C